MKQIIKRVGIMLLMIIGAAISGLILLTLVELIPNSLIDKHLERSIDIFQVEGSGPSTSQNFESVRDNDTDAEILLISSYKGDISAFEDALLVKWQSGNPVNSLINHYTQPGVDEEFETYGRYWHGYQIIVRPLLLFTTYRGIRIFSFLCMVIGVAYVCFWLIKRAGIEAIFPYVITVLLMVPASIYKCMTFAFCFFVAQIVIQIYLANMEFFEENNRFIYLCLLSGILTSFFDLLTYPLYTLGMLLCIRMLVKKRDLINDFVASIGHCLAWCLGYGIMWISKWALVTGLTDYNMFAEGMSNVAYRSGTAEVERFGAIDDNLRYFFGNKVALVIMLVYLLVAIVIKIYKKDINLRDLVIFGTICLFPFVWYVFANQHSWWHAFFACKELGIFSMALMCMCTYKRGD